MIVVGFDGSDHARRALGWATEQARMRGVELRVVTAIPKASASFWPAMPAVDSEGTEKRTRQQIDAAIRELGDALEGVRVTRQVVREEHPARALCRAAEDAELLVVGSRGRGGFSGLMLGSTSQQATAYAPCPVTVVREEH